LSIVQNGRKEGEKRASILQAQSAQPTEGAGERGGGKKQRWRRRKRRKRDRESLKYGEISKTGRAIKG
jgi:hypothetical protein